MKSKLDQKETTKKMATKNKVYIIPTCAAWLEREMEDRIPEGEEVISILYQEGTGFVVTTKVLQDESKFIKVNKNLLLENQKNEKDKGKKT